MGLILGALAGAGQQAADFADKQITQDHALERERVSSDLALDRAKALEVAKVALGNQQRTEQVARVRTEAERIADEKLAPKLKGRDMERQQEAAGTLVGPTQDPDEVDAQLAQQRSGLVNNAITDGSAAVRTGDISPKDAATLNQRSEADLTRLMLGDQRAQTMALIASGHDDTRKLVAGMMAATKKDTANKEDKVIVHQFLGQFDRKITENGKDIRSLRSSLDSAPRDKRAEIQAQIDDLTRQNRNLTNAQIQYAKEAGVKVPTSMDGEAPAPAPAGALPPGIPAGSKQIGTSGGKPVYQAPDGKRYKVE